jgi:4-hydroxy-tetrahydrodipicolinate synthase
MSNSNNHSLRGVIAAIPTPFDDGGAPDTDAFVALGRHLLATGCDGLNVLGTTGEATSLSVAERITVMRAASRALPREKLMVGVGAAAISDACELAVAAGELGFAGALVLPPFYYKDISEEGLLASLAAVADATSNSNIPLYLYQIPALSGVFWTVDLVRKALDLHPKRVVGLKNSSGDLDYSLAAAAIHPDFSVFPSNEAVLLTARTGSFAGCISGSANINADLCARAWRAGDSSALEQAGAIRGLLDGMSFVPAVKAMLASQLKQPGLARVRAPLVSLAAEGAQLARSAALVRAPKR